MYRNEIHHSAAERTQVLQDVAADPTLPRTKSVRCSQCGHGEAVFFQVIFICLFFLLYLTHKYLHITTAFMFTNMPEFLVSVAGQFKASYLSFDLMWIFYLVYGARLKVNNFGCFSGIDN